MLKRVILLVVAAALLLISAGMGVAAGWAYSALGPDGVMRFPLGTITPDASTSTTIIDVDRYSLTIPYIQDYGTVTLEATTGESADPSDVLFLGAAATQDVDAYLKGTPYAVAFRTDDEWQTRAVPGTATAAPPREQSFWLAAAVGREPAIEVPEERPLTLVITHPAGLPTGPFDLRFGFSVPDASTWIVGMAAAAALLLIVAIVLIIVAFRVKRTPKRRGKHEANPTDAPAAPTDADVPVAVAATVEAVPAEPVAGELVAAEPVGAETVPVGADTIDPTTTEPTTIEHAPTEAMEPVVEAEPTAESTADPTIEAESLVATESESAAQLEFAIESEPVVEAVPVVDDESVPVDEPVPDVVAELVDAAEPVAETADEAPEVEEAAAPAEVPEVDADPEPDGVAEADEAPSNEAVEPTTDDGDDARKL